MSEHTTNFGEKLMDIISHNSSAWDKQSSEAGEFDEWTLPYQKR